LESWNVEEEAQWVVIHLGFDDMPCWAMGQLPHVGGFSQSSGSLLDQLTGILLAFYCQVIIHCWALVKMPLMEE
jgi:hypothetical protein